MPVYVHLIRIDWHVDEASASLRAQLPAASQDLDSTDHTFDTFTWRLRLFAQAHPAARVDALVEDGYRVRWFVHAQDGEVTERQVYPVLADVNHDSAIDGIELDYESEAELIAAVDAASDAHAEGTMVADVGWDRYLVQLAGGGANVLEAYPVDSTLFARLAQEQYTRPGRAPRKPDEKYEQALYWAEDMLRLLEEEGTRTDRSLSYLVQLAWKHARARIAKSDASTLRSAVRTFYGDKCKQTLYFPGTYLDEMEREAARLDCSLSLIAQSAVAYAQDELSKLQR